jgi:hypothetical protein
MGRGSHEIGLIAEDVRLVIEIDGEQHRTPFEGVGHGIPARQQWKSRRETAENFHSPDRGIAALYLLRISSKR